jgi:hypothetical protein
MSPFCKSVKMAVPPLNKFPCSKTAPPLPEATAPVLTSLLSPFYKSHCSPRLGAVPSFPWPAWQFGPAIKPCSMDVSLFWWAFFESGIFPNIWSWNPGSGWVPGTDLALPAFLWDLSCFTRTPDPRKWHSLTSSQGSSSTPVHLQPPSTTGQSSLKVLSPSVSPPHTLSCCLSLISSKTLVLGRSLLSSRELGSPLGTVDSSGSEDVLSGGFFLHFSLSLLRAWYFRDARHISPQVRPSPWELDRPKFLQTPQWDVSWPTLGPSA